MRSNAQVLEIEDALGQPPEEAGHGTFEDFAARAQDACGGRDIRRERNQIVFGAAGAVKQKQRRRLRAGRRVKDVFEPEITHGRR